MDLQLVVMDIQEAVLCWYKRHGRPLPWRQTTDPYKILFSEIMLQQTQVDRVIPKYHAFLEQFPTVEALAKAETADVLRAWSGLGYNRRALALKRCAEIIVEQYHGQFPETTKELETLPGLGSYTAAAVLSFAWNKHVPVIDVNIERIFKRIYYGKVEQVNSLALHLLPVNKSRDWHNALMDIGALFCTATNPKCDACPLIKLCASANNEERISATWKKRNVVPFKESDRIVRGTILKLLTKENGQSIDALYQQLIAMNIQREKEKFHTIVEQLEKDGLVVEEGDKLFLP